MRRANRLDDQKNALMPNRTSCRSTRYLRPLVSTHIWENPYMTPPKNLGMLLLAVWLILFGLLSASFVDVSFSHSADILAVLAITAGALLLIQR